MHYLGVPTTRALSLVLTGEQVLRDMFYDGNPRLEPGAIVCRVAPSFIRFGNFQLPASRGDLALLNQLIDFTIRRDFPELKSAGEPGDPAVRAEWFAQVAERTARMVADWMRVGFVHGVMNTDNMSILGLTIDYGPYGWVDDFDPNWTPNTTDAGGRRYRFGAQEQIAYWNLARFGEALVPVMPSVELLHAGMERFVNELSRVSQLNIAAKLGLRDCSEDGVALMHDLQRLLYSAEVDMTIFFRRLADVDLDTPSLDTVAPASTARRSAATTSPPFEPGSSVTASACVAMAPTPTARAACARPTRDTCSAISWRSRPSIVRSRATSAPSPNCSRCSATRTTTSRVRMPTTSGGRIGPKTGRGVRCCRAARDAKRGAGSCGGGAPQGFAGWAPRNKPINANRSPSIHLTAEPRTPTPNKYNR
jgi:hypothetical protein